ncbi:MAG: NUDIX domain-containing protein [Magnetococcus sp. WYHC-3]
MKVDIQQIKTTHRGFLHLEEVRLRHQRFDGSMTPPLMREHVRRPDSAAVVLYDPRTDSVVLIRQFRIGPYLAGAGGWQWEIVAGMADGQDQGLEQLARREALEEAGFALEQVRPMLRFFPSPGVSNESVQLFLGVVDSRCPVDKGGGLDHEGEDIAVHVLPGDEVAAMVATGQIDNATALLGLMWLLARREGLRREWLAQGSPSLE